MSLMKRSLAVLVTIVCCSSSAFAFSEDLCVKKLTGKLDSCNSVNCSPTEKDISKCNVNIVLKTAATTFFGVGRSMIHYDSIYVLAQAVGLRADLAYWLAVYNQMADLGSETHIFNNCGKTETDPKKLPVGFNGWVRTHFPSGGLAYHFATFYLPPGETEAPKGYTGIAPKRVGDDLDALYEGPLYALQQWALKDKLACTNGFTTANVVPTTSSEYSAYFSGDSCYEVDPSFSTKLIRGNIPVVYSEVLQLGPGNVPLSVYQGNQFADVGSESSESIQSCPTQDTTYASHYADQSISDACNVTPSASMAQLLKQGTGRLYKSATDVPVPLELAKMGLYLHVLQDRISHHQCGDVSYVTGPTDLSAQGETKAGFWWTYDLDACDSVWHAVGHYMEVGVDPVAMRTYTALSYAYDELKRFKAHLQEKVDKGGVENGSTDWFTDKNISKEAIIGAVITRGSERIDEGAVVIQASAYTLLKALSDASGLERVNKMRELITHHQLLQFDSDSDSCN